MRLILKINDNNDKLLDYIQRFLLVLDEIPDNH